jgi:hypothetical protein
VSASANPAKCPFTGAPCVLALDVVQLELMRVRGREESRTRHGQVCTRCLSEASAIPLGGGKVCYACKSGHPTEDDHVRGGHSGPAVWRIGSNAHRIANEAERILVKVADIDLCIECRVGIALRVGIELARVQGGRAA